MLAQQTKLARTALTAGMILATASGFDTHAIGVYSMYETRDYKKGTGYIGFDTSAFYYKSSSRGVAATTLEALIHGDINSSKFRGHGDLMVNTFVNDRPDGVVESHEAYLETQDGVLGNHRLALGRKYIEWSKVDKPWNMMSLWSPRYTWDQLHPESIGMTGAFYSYETPKFKLLAFASPIAVPERGTPVAEKDHNIVSPNPFWKPLPTELNFGGNIVPVQYSLRTPPLQDILFRPNFAIKGRYEFSSGVWASINTGVLPVHMVQMAAEAFADVSGTSAFQVNIRPQFPMRNINTVEVGYDSPNKDWNVWLSGSYEQPFQFQNNKYWFNPILTPTSIFSAGTQVQMTSNFWFDGSALFIHEQPFVRDASVPNVRIDLPTRFPLKQGFRIGGNWRFNDYTQGDIAWIQDLVQQNHMVSLDVKHNFPHSTVSIGGGTDFLVAKTTQGFMGMYYGDDRLRGWLKYAF